MIEMAKIKFSTTHVKTKRYGVCRLAYVSALHLPRRESKKKEKGQIQFVNMIHQVSLNLFVFAFVFEIKQ